MAHSNTLLTRANISGEIRNDTTSHHDQQSVYHALVARRRLVETWSQSSPTQECSDTWYSVYHSRETYSVWYAASRPDKKAVQLGIGDRGARCFTTTYAKVNPEASDYDRQQILVTRGGGRLNPACYTETVPKNALGELLDLPETKVLLSGPCLSILV